MLDYQGGKLSAVSDQLSVRDRHSSCSVRINSACVTWMYQQRE